MTIAHGPPVLTLAHLQVLLDLHVGRRHVHDTLIADECRTCGLIELKPWHGMQLTERGQQFLQTVDGLMRLL